MTTLLRLSQTRANYYLGFGIDLGMSGALLLGAWASWTGTWWHAAPLAILGILAYTLIQYSFHRWGGHGPIRVLAEGHGWHHEHPEAPAAMPFFVYPAVVFLLWRGFQLWLPLPEASLLAGAIYGTCCYDGLSHHLQHRGWRGGLHQAHHAEPTTHFGQTTTLWDAVFRTRT